MDCFLSIKSKTFNSIHLPSVTDRARIQGGFSLVKNVPRGLDGTRVIIMNFYRLFKYILKVLNSCCALGRLPCLSKEFIPALKIDQLNENCQIVMLFSYFVDKRFWNKTKHTSSCVIVLIVAEG